MKSCVFRFYSASWKIALIIIAGLVLRVFVAFRGHNYDFESYLVVLQKLDLGLNIYVSTTRYNYGPVWFLMLRGMYIIAFRNIVVFRFVLAVFLSLVDLGIFYVLLKRNGLYVASLFLLNPISVIITGYHNQFDNLAILLGMLSVLLMGDDYDKPVENKKFFALIILGISLMTKHLFFAFPLWLALKQKGLLQKILMVFVPTLVFISGFAPFWSDGAHGIIENVFLYNSWPTQYFYRLLIPSFVKQWITSKEIWLIALVVFAFIFRRKTVFESLLAYTCILVVSSPATTNQYLSIVVPFISVYPNPWFLAYTFLAGWHLIIDLDGLNLPLFSQFSLNKDGMYMIIIIFLCMGTVWYLWRSFSPTVQADSTG